MIARKWSSAVPLFNWQRMPVIWVEILISLFAPVVLASKVGGSQNGAMHGEVAHSELLWLQKRPQYEQKFCNPLTLIKSNGAYFNLTHKVVQTLFMLPPSSLFLLPCTANIVQHTCMGSVISYIQNFIWKIISQSLKWMLSSFLYLLAANKGHACVYLYRLG